MDKNEYKLEFEADSFPIDQLPDPVGWRILLAPVTVKEKSTGGIILPEQAKQVLEYFRTVGKVLKVGPECYKHPKFNGGAWCVPGDVVQFAPYVGLEVVVALGDEVNKLKLINDDDVLTVVNNPEVLNFL